MQKSSDSAIPAAQQATKKQGPIRFEAIIPLAIVIGLIMLYFMLFFDLHLRRGFEYGATLVNGAEVNIGSLDTSLWDASVVLGNIEMTNPGVPTRNRLHIGAVNFRMLWDALLRGKVVIDEASINEVQIDTPRKSAGRVLPVEISEDDEGAGAKVLARMKEEFSGNAIGDLAAIAAGADPKEQLSAMGGDLRSSAHLTEMQKLLEEKNKQWQSRIAAMPKSEEFTALQRRLANVKLDNLQDATQIQASLKELESIRNDFDAKSKSVNETSAALKGEAASFRASYAELDRIAKGDVRSLQERMNLPSLDARTLSGALFGMDVLGKVQQARVYMDQARSYMPVKSEKKQAMQRSQRHQGRDYAFGQPNSYPVFWLRKALISSRLSDGAGDLSGEITHVTNNPALVGHPMVATIRGNLPQQGISGINAALVIDHTSTVPAERLTMEVGRYAVAGRSLVASPSVELDLAKAEGRLKFTAELHDESVAMRISNQFTDAVLDTRAQTAVVREMISASVAGLNTVNIDAHVTGTWSNLEWQLTTSLADALQRGMRRYLESKMEEARARIEAMVYGKIKDQRKLLETRQGEIESPLRSGLAERQAQVDKLRAELDERRNALVGAQQQMLKKESGKLLDGLRKKF